MEEVADGKKMEFVEVMSYKDMPDNLKKGTGSTEDTDSDEPSSEQKKEKPKKTVETDNGIIYGCMLTRSGKETLHVARDIKSAYYLYPHLIFEGECSCLFSDTNVGKSIFAVQLGCEIARKYNYNVAYYDFELSTKQFANRYSDEEGEYDFPNTFYRMEIDPKYAEDSSQDIISDIEFAAEQIRARILIIDNLSWLVMDNENAQEANDLMRAIKGMQKRHRWTILVVAHTPKRSVSLPLSLNDLAGSRQLANFFDSIFALGRCLTQPRVRYLKQLKVRAEDTLYSSSNVVTFNIEKADHMLQFIRTGYSTEKDMLATEEELQAKEVTRHILELALEGLSAKEIAAETGETESKVKKIIKNQTFAKAQSLEDKSVVSTE